MQRHVYSALDGLRGIAAIAVLEHHFAVPSGLPKRDASGLAVDLFFVLSGFVLAHAYGSKLAAGMSATEFMRLRLIRLLPMAVLGALIAAAAVLIGGDARPLSAMASLGLTAVMLPSPPGLVSSPWLFPYNLPMWSLFFELAANLLFALIGRQLTTLRVGVVTAGAGIWLATQSSWGGPDWASFIQGFPRVMFGFFLGVLLYRLQGRLPAPKAPPWALCIVLAAMLYGLDGGLYTAFCLLLGWPLLVHLAANAEPDPRTRRWLTLVGGASYPLYVIHIPAKAVIFAVASSVMHRPIAHFGPVVGLAIMLILIGLAAALDRSVDRPLRQFLQRPRYA